MIEIFGMLFIYRQDHDEISLYSSVTSYLVSKYRDNNQFISTFYIFGEPNNVIMQIIESSGSFTKVREYRSNMYRLFEALQKAEPKSYF